MELKTLGTGLDAHINALQAVKEELKGLLPMRKYKLSRCWQDIFEKACGALHSDALKEARVKYPKEYDNGTLFGDEKNGTYMVMRRVTYDYAHNQTWQVLKREIEQSEEDLKTQRAALRELEKQLREDAEKAGTPLEVIKVTESLVLRNK